MSPMVAGPSDWAVPHASRLKYRQQFNGLDKQMTGYLTGMIPVHVQILETIIACIVTKCLSAEAHEGLQAE